MITIVLLWAKSGFRSNLRASNFPGGTYPHTPRACTHTNRLPPNLKCRPPLLHSVMREREGVKMDEGIGNCRDEGEEMKGIQDGRMEMYNYTHVDNKVLEGGKSYGLGVKYCLLLPSLALRPSWKVEGRSGVLSDTPCHMGWGPLRKNCISHLVLESFLTDYTFSNWKVTLLHVARKITQNTRPPFSNVRGSGKETDCCQKGREEK